MTLGFLLLLASFICFLLATFGVNTGRVSVGWLGLALWVLAVLSGGAGVHIR